MEKAIVIKVFEASVESTLADIKEEDLKLISHQEFFFKNNTPRHIQMLLANLARWINEKR